MHFGKFIYLERSLERLYLQPSLNSIPPGFFCDILPRQKLQVSTRVLSSVTAKKIILLRLKFHKNLSQPFHNFYDNPCCKTKESNIKVHVEKYINEYFELKSTEYLVQRYTKRIYIILFFPFLFSNIIKIRS